MSGAGDRVHEFMSRVVPWPSHEGAGYVNLHWLRPGLRDPSINLWSGKVCTSPDRLLEDARWGAAQSTVKDIYYCLSLQKQAKVKNNRLVPMRNQANAVSLKSVWIDVDVKTPPKGYASTAEAIDAINEFTKASNLPAPSAMVYSGSGGVHVYWISDRELTVNEWLPYATALKQMALSHGLRCDAGCTVDSARVLRVPGTYNYKDPDNRKAVKLLGLQTHDYNLAEIFKDRISAVKVIPRNGPEFPFDLSNFPKKDGVVESLSEGIERYEFKPLDFEPLVKECSFFCEALRTGGKEFSQPQWNLSTLGATFLEHGHALAHKMAEAHPEYTYDSTEELWQRKQRERAEKGLGYPGCNAIHTAGWSACSACPHFTKGKSPLNLTRPRFVPPVTAAVSGPAQDDYLLPLDKGFVLDADGIVCKVETVERKGQPPENVYLPLFERRIFRPFSEKGGKRGFCLNFMTTTDRANTVQVSIPIEAAANNDKLAAALLKQGVLIYVKNKRFLSEFIVAWMNKLWDEQDASEARPLGWLEDETTGDPCGFIYGGIVYHANGKETMSGMGDAATRAIYRPTGNEAKWRKAFDMVINQNRPELNVIMCTACAAPLMRLADVSQVMLSTWGMTGGGKSAAMDVGQAIWGHAKKAKDQGASTTNAVAGRAGNLRHLPIYWDEIKDEKTQDSAINFAFGQEGLEKARMNGDGSLRDRGEWQTIGAINGNICLADHVARIHKTHAGGLMRIFEYTVSTFQPGQQGVISNTEATKIVADCQRNYGWFGQKYAKFLAMNIKRVTETTKQVQAEFERELRCTPEERFWLAFCATNIAAAIFMNELGLPVPVKPLKDFLKQKFIENRDKRKSANVEGGTQFNTEQALNQYLKGCREFAIWTSSHHMGVGKPKAVTLLRQPRNPDAAIYVQWSRDGRLLRISRKHFEDYLYEQKYSKSTIFDGLRLHFRMCITKGRIGAGTTYKDALKEDLLDIPVHPEADNDLWDMMTNFGGEDEPKEGSTDADKQPAQV